MTAFARFFVEFLWTLIRNIGDFFASVGIAIYNFFISDVGEYFRLVGYHMDGFGVFGWIFLIIVSVIITVFVGFIVYRLWLFIRRYFVYRVKHVRTDKIMEEVARLKLQADEMAKEKKFAFAEKLQKELEPILQEEKESLPSEPVIKDETIRFASLVEVDRFYEENPNNVQMAESELISLREMVKNVVAYSATQLNLYYEEDMIRQFFAALATSKLVIVEGITGAGKTSLPHAVGCYFNHQPMIVPVTPDWHDSTEFLGYYDDFNNQFVETSYLAEIYAASYRKEPDFIVLDEMNLARAEYYFSDFLSLMDVPDVSEWKIELVPAVSTNDPKNFSYGKLPVSQNIWFIGTANTDDTTFAISDDVYERAMIIQLNQIAEPFEADPVELANCSSDYLQTLFDRAQHDHAIKTDNMHRIEELDTFLGQRFAVKFGTRLMKQLSAFVSVYVACGGKESDGIDIFVCNKVLRKLVPLNLQFLVRELNDLIVWMNHSFGSRKMPRSIEYLQVLQKVN